MAEGDSIARLAARLDRQLAGRTIRASRFQVGHLALTDVSGRRVDQVRSVGKHLLVRLSGGLSIHLHLRMDGRLSVRTGPVRGPLHHSVRLALDLGDVVLIGERVPVVEVVATAGEHRVIGHLGPDLCDPGWGTTHAATAVTRLRSAPTRPLVEALLDQRNLAGIGNLYAVEGCFLGGLHPWAPVGTVDLDRLVDLEHRLLSAGVATGGQVTTGDRRPGRTHWVYGRYRRPCRRCGTPVAFRPGDGSAAHRETWWCPHCQPDRR